MLLHVVDQQTFEGLGLHFGMVGEHLADQLEALIQREQGLLGVVHRNQHHDQVLRRVARTAEVQQKEKNEKLITQQKHVEERLEHVAKIRALLK